MKHLLENWREFITEEYEPVTTLHIFDFDETIAHTQSETKVWVPGRSKAKNPESPDARLTNQKEFEDYMQGQAKLRDIETFDPVRDLEAIGYEIDLSDFERVVNPEEITGITDQLRKVLDLEHSKTYIITARRGKSIGPILDYLDSINIDPNKVRTMATQGQSKGDVMATMLRNKIMPNGKSNINTVHYYEDSEKNIKDVIQKLTSQQSPEDDVRPEDFKLIIHQVKDRVPMRPRLYTIDAPRENLQERIDNGWKRFMNEAKDTKVSSKVAILNEDGKVLTVKITGSEKFDAPGGHRKEGETAEEAAIREVKEETGLEVKSLTDLGKNEENTKHFFKTSDFSGTIELQKEEVSDYEWIDPSSEPEKSTSALKQLLSKLSKK